MYYIDNINITFSFIGLSEPGHLKLIKIYLKSLVICTNNAMGDYNVNTINELKSG